MGVVGCCIGDGGWVIGELRVCLNGEMFVLGRLVMGSVCGCCGGAR